jgi:hypothetical protein
VTAGDDRFARVIAAIDARNAADPFTIEVDGHPRPKELAHAELMTEWVLRLDPDATPEQLLAARAHHVERWVLERSAYPEGRAGYLRWRRDLSRHHGAVVAEAMTDAGYPPEAIERVVTIVRKQGLGSDPAVQVHEDALCLVFLATQLAPVCARLGRDKTVEVIAKTIPKMSSAGLDAVGAIGLPPDLLAVVADAATLAAGGARPPVAEPRDDDVPDGGSTVI